MKEKKFKIEDAPQRHESGSRRRNCRHGGAALAKCLKLEELTDVTGHGKIGVSDYPKSYRSAAETDCYECRTVGKQRFVRKSRRRRMNTGFDWYSLT